ncbi:MAG: hypoxanthine-guanine phosphoribosyltransferase [Xanthomonadales bacterium]|nr:hypoxanthine-guanine phosphoribosyltransferase [Xanthomonadales bacterium]NNL94857.1 hypoxanthine-guanine phosphoribosyltransferase [Xanthomonadales bacterium]
MGLAPAIQGHPDPDSLLEKSTVLFTREQVSEALDKMAEEINAFYGNESIVMIAVMTGAIMPAAWLATRLKMPMQMDFVHATRYQSGLHGAELEYRVPPRMDLEGKKVLVVDDIFDEGDTLAAIKGSVEQRKAESVHMAVLTRKMHNRGLPRDFADFVGLDVPDVYVFGCGMDAYEEWRHLDEILVLNS